MDDEREPNQDDEHPPKPADAPVETPEADPRTKGAPDPEERSVDSNGSGPSADTTEEQIQEGFE